MGFILVKFTPEQISQVRQLSTTNGFVEAFQQNIAECRTFYQAYELTETQHEAIFGRRKFSSYHSFSVCRRHARSRHQGK